LMMDRSRSSQDIISHLQNQLDALTKRVDILSTRTPHDENPTWLILGVDIPYASGISTYPSEWGGAPTPQTGIAKLSNGMVIGRGLMQTPPVAQQHLFTVPAGYRPANTPYARILNTPTSGTGANESMRMYTAAGIAAGYGVAGYPSPRLAWTLYDQTGNAWISLEGFLWMAEQ
jgi:hypothetical protein